MFDPVGFFQGFNEQQETDERKRIELAQAFQELRAANPYATGMELQSYVQQLGGGRNFLRGGMPSGQVLQGIAESNAAAKQRMLDDRKRTIASDNMNLALNRANLMTTLSGFADDALLNSGLSSENTVDQNNKLLKDAEDSVVEMFGGRETFDGLGLSTDGLFTNERYNRLRTAEVSKYLPQALELIKANKGDIDALTLQNTYGIPSNMVDGVIAAAKKQYAQEQATFEFNNETALINRAVAFMNEGVDITDALTSISLDTENKFGFALSDDLKNKIQTEATRIYNRREEEQKQADNDRIGGLMATAIENIRNNVDFRTAVFTGNPQTIQDAFDKAVARAPADVQDKLKEQQDSLVAEIVNTLQFEQRDRIAAASDAFDASIPQKQAAITSENQEIVNTYFGIKRQGQDTPYRRDALLAATTLAKQYRMSPYAISLLQNAWDQQARDAGVDPQASSVGFEEMLGLGQSILAQGGVMDLNDFVDQAVGQDRSRAGLVGPTGPVEAATWVANTQQEMDNSILGLESAARKVLASSDPDAIERGIAAVMRKFENELAVFSTSVDAAIKYSYGKDRWVLAGTDGLDTAEARRMLMAFQDQANTFRETLAMAQNKADTIRAQNTSNTSLTPQTIKDNKDKLQNIANGYTRRRAPRGDDKAMKEFVRIPGILDTIAGNAQMFADFSNDPVGYMKVHKLPSGTVWYDQWKANNP